MKDELQSGYKPVQDEVLKTIGLAVIAGQGVERLLQTCLRFPFHGQPLQTEEQVKALLGLHSKATLGKLLSVLRQRVDLLPEFGVQLDRFLENRNVIAHRLHDTPGGLDLHSDVGRERLLTFLIQFLEDAHHVNMVLVGVLREWASQQDIVLPGEHHLSRKMHAYLDANVTPHLEDLISLKDPLVNS